MIDIVIPYINSLDGLELRYCLRSIYKHLSGFNRIYIVGDKPKWLMQTDVSNVIHVPIKNENQFDHKERTIMNKIMHVIENYSLSQQFFYMNDDHYFLQSYDVRQFPNYHDTDMDVKSLVYKQNESNPYNFTVTNTIKIVGNKFKFYDLHCPIRFDKDKFVQAMKSVDWNVRWGYCMKTIYMHYHDYLIGTQYFDTKLKTHREKTDFINNIKFKGYFFSTDDKMIDDGFEKFLSKLYPTRLSHEKYFSPWLSL